MTGQDRIRYVTVGIQHTAGMCVEGVSVNYNSLQAWIHEAAESGSCPCQQAWPAPTIRTLRHVSPPTLRHCTQQHLLVWTWTEWDGFTDGVALIYTVVMPTKRWCHQGAFGSVHMVVCRRHNAASRKPLTRHHLYGNSLNTSTKFLLDTSPQPGCLVSR